MGTHVFDGFDTSFDEMCKQVYPQIDSVDHVHHAGNSSGVVDGASAVLLASPDYAQAHGLTPRARIVMSAVMGAEPVIMLTAPGPASKRCLERAGMTVDDIDLWEINEAFAAIPMKAIRDLGIDPAKVNVNGGAIALGHPIGATGGILIQTALDELERRDRQHRPDHDVHGRGHGHRHHHRADLTHVITVRSGRAVRPTNAQLQRRGHRVPANRTAPRLVPAEPRDERREGPCLLAQARRPGLARHGAAHGVRRPRPLGRRPLHRRRAAAALGRTGGAPLGRRPPIGAR